MKAAERAERDDLVLSRFLGGANYREIAAEVSLTARRVEDIVKAGLAAAAKRRLTLTDEALAIYLERFERLYQQQWARAEGGNQRAAELCERMLARHARLFEVAEEMTPDPRLPAPTPTANPGGGDEDQDDGPRDELSQLRAARNGA
ncbi:hypothetical protein [Mycolicibacterium fluoranthenivorans]|uniref:Uncharacterized protein n=1 Tax=Mycolicibacterium fluoranthenivorans TaxID=258505 RepID=A0A1G4VF90_9MYCO|nr:hypothetical protein [Mycolicibacterium fluoranthenivorans]SCX05927.1 hypothetical protein SAMN02799620_00782 [Mycolicibacterium fluoranthenivorans]